MTAAGPVCELSRALGERIRDERKHRGWSQYDLAAEAKVTQGVIAFAELGQRNLTLANLAAIARALQVPPWLLLMDGDPADAHRDAAERIGTALAAITRGADEVREQLTVMAATTKTGD